MSALNDELTPEELAYIESGGKTELSIKAPETSEPAPAAPEPAPEAAPQPATPAAPAAAEPAKTDAQAPAPTAEDGEDDGLEVVEVKDGRARGKDGKFVSHKALHAERQKHKATKAELEQLRIDRARAEERIAILNEAFNGQQAQQQQPAQPAKKEEEPNPFQEQNIDPLQDFAAAIDQQNRRNQWLANQYAKSEQRTTQIEQQTQQRDAMATLRTTYHNDVAAFRQQTPDFMDAYQHLVKGRLAELELQGVRDPVQRKKIIEQEETQLVAQALQSNQSPAQLIYGVAKARGYVAKPATPAAAAPAATPTPTPAPNAAAEKIRQLQNGQNAAQTLSNVGGQAAPTLTHESLARMSQEEFNAFADKLTEKQLMQYLGGP